MGSVQLDVLDIVEYKLEARIMLPSLYQFARVLLLYISIRFPLARYGHGVKHTGSTLR